MKILFHYPAPDTLSAGRTVYFGYKHAFEDLGHEFRTLTQNHDQEKVFTEFKPDIFITALGILYMKFLNLDVLAKQKKRGLKVFVNTPFWNSPISVLRLNETSSLSHKKNWVDLIKSGGLGDIYYNICEQDDPRMEGFEQTTGYKHHTILLAADKILLFPEFDVKFKADISYVGTYLPGKRDFFKKHVFPLQKRYNLKTYGQDWTAKDRALGFVKKVGQYLNNSLLKSVQKSKLALEDERKIYSSSKISINIHEEYQRKYGDINERTFKIPLCGGFEISDNVRTIGKYLKEEKEIIIAKDTDDWHDKIDFFLKNPEKRVPIIKAGRSKVLKEHTYHHRVENFLKIYKSIK